MELPHIRCPPLSTVEKQAMGTATTSLTSVALGKMDHNHDLAKQEEIIKIASVTTYAGKQRDPMLVAITILAHRVPLCF